MFNLSKAQKVLIGAGVTAFWAAMFSSGVLAIAAVGLFGWAAWEAYASSDDDFDDYAAA